MKIAIPLLFSLAAVASGVDLDLANLGELQKDEHPVVPEQLAAVIDNADRVVVKGGPWSDSTKVYESSRRKDLKALSKALVVVKPDQWFHCMCFGGAAICLYKNEELLASITIHHGTSIRWSKWSSDAAIADVDNWLKWLADRNIDGPGQEIDRERKRREQSKQDWKKWIEAIPEGLESVLEDSLGPFGEVQTKPLMMVLTANIPDKKDQILALLQWFGSGAGPWSGFPAYESAVEQLLLEFQKADIVSVIESNQLSAQQTEGAARLLGSWGFYDKQPAGLDQVPVGVKKLLWEHVKNTEDSYKIARTDWIFNPKG